MYEDFEIEKEFESNVFSKEVMKARLPEKIFNSLLDTIDKKTIIKKDIAEVVAKAMKDWAIEKGATHYTHWFQPMTGAAAEKHESFIEFTKDGNITLAFSGNELVKGEPDASSFPTGGVRSTFEARGYTAWDPTSYAFLKDEVLCIPTAFYSYSGEALDKKTPLLRSIQALEKQGKRILKLFGDLESKIDVNVGAEQEYFLIDEEEYLDRKDLIYSGRTLFGAPPSKGQELDDHYFGSIKPRVLDYMKELDEELWKLGIASKTRHNEVAPAQHEIAVIYESANKATDHNQIIMETLKKVAGRHDLRCLLNEKPFAGVNGSGKHCNWSLATSKGENLLNPGKTPKENARFLLFLAAVITAIDNHQDLMRVGVASAGNDHRLGANEAPPAIISAFIGTELEEILDAIKTGENKKNKKVLDINIGVDILPSIPKDTTDRNRTSPFAFTGNKFEFRMVGSSASVAGPMFILNTIIASTLRSFADKLEKAENFERELSALIKRAIKRHEKIIFNGNNYSDEWEKEAEKRGLLNLKTTVDALATFDTAKNIKLFEKEEVLSKTEIESRKDLLLEEYWKTINIEALTMRNLVRKSYIPAISEYTSIVIQTLLNKETAKKSLAIKNTGDALEKDILNVLGPLSEKLQKQITKLESVLQKVPCTDNMTIAKYYKDEVLKAMNNLRMTVDKLEVLVDKNYWPVASYGEILYSVR
ncbi:MAG: glutamine synthetase III [Clostridiales Family XIII bacterium]|nr:glutamine synthetase III [Clostridiales Family XIII bacterium]